MLLRLKQHLDKNLPFLKDKKLLIAVSGGIDSIVLVHLLKELNYTIGIAHCNFNLRGEESDGDEAFVRNLALTQNIDIHVKHFETKVYADVTKLSIQVAARKLRYAWFNELMERLGYDYLVTAHHLDDSAETFLINFTRGTGIEGLLGIPEQNGTIVRPLLPFTRAEIEAYAKENNIAWREDSSNASDKYLRNKLRHHILPVLKELNPSFGDSFIATVSHLKQVHSLAGDAASLVYKQVVNQTGNQERICIIKLLEYSNYEAYLFRWLHKYNFTAWQDLYDLVHAQPGKFVLSDSHRILKDRDVLIIEPLKLQESTFLEISGIGEYTTDSIDLQLDFVHDIDVNAPKNTVYIDYQKINFPLFVRRWREGDSFYPLGMNGLRKKVSKFFKDEKMSLSDKENAWLLSSEDEIIWIVGRRADDRFKITTQTTQILKIEVK